MVGRQQDDEYVRLDEELRQIEETIEASEGWRLYRKMVPLRGSYYVFEGNHHYLIQGLDQLAQPELLTRVMSQGDETAHQTMFFEVSRLLHNFLAAAKTLVDHTRIFVEDMYARSDFWNVYQRRKDSELVNTPVVQFVQRLRNYTLHYALPVTTTKLRLERVDEARTQSKGSLTLSVGKLREWQDWNVRSREYLDTLEDQAEISVIANEYKNVVGAFYGWFDKQLDILHGKDFENLRALEQRRVDIEQRLMQTWPTAPE